MSGSRDFDLILVGGGLANGLIALRLARLRPDLRILVVEAGPTLGGNHTWSFHARDLTEDQSRWLAPLVVHRWDDYEVAFPDLSRRVALGYRTVTAERFHAVLTGLPVSVRLDSTIAAIAPDHIVLADGERLTAPAVIDGRGYQPSRHLVLAYQKFLGCEVRLDAPHGLAAPILMDARMPQSDGYRFVYTLPFAEDRLLIEDTYYADGPDLDPALLRSRIAAYAAGRGWRIAETIREEHGILPITLDGDPDGFWREAPQGMPRAGLRAGLFHPTTGYSLPDAARLADLVAGLPVPTSAAIDAAIRAHAGRRWRAQGFFRALNRMLFRAGAPSRRYRMMQRFYGLPDGLIARFYAGDLTFTDKLRLLAGRPPVPVLGAIRALLRREKAKP